jgi:hypothetical protein
LQKRSRLFNDFLKRKPTFEQVRSVIREYQPSLIVGNGSDRNETVSCFQALNWGERFVSAYNQLIAILQVNNQALSENLPKLCGLKTFVSTSGHFCAIVYSEEVGIQFDDLSLFDNHIVQSIASLKTSMGFCLHGHLLPTVDPEVIAFLQVVVWLNFLIRKDTEEYSDWIGDISSFSVLTPNDWVDWKSQERIEFIDRSNRQPQEVIFEWQDFYTPITFCVDPVVTPPAKKLHSTRHGSLAYTSRPGSHISLILLLSKASKIFAVDLGTRAYIPMPSIKLNRQFFTEAIHMNYVQGGPLISLIHLRG